MCMHMKPIKIFWAIVSREEGACISPHCAMNIARLVGARDPATGLSAFDIVVQPTPHDLVRARSRMACIALDSDYSHILFQDGDVSVKDPVRAVQNMLAANVDVVHTIYRKKKQEIDYPVVPLPGRNIVGHVREVAAVPMGFTLISRACLERMWEISLPFLDVWGGVNREPRAMFMLRHEGRELLSEDFSFCRTWRDLGGQVWVNLLDHCDHFGSHLFESPK